MGSSNVFTNAASIIYERNAGLREKTLGHLIGTVIDLVTGPKLILIKHSPHDTERAFGPIFRLFLRLQDGGIESWMVFRREREWQEQPDDIDPGSVLWHAAWDHKADRTSESWRSDPFPTIRIAVIYATEQQSRVLGSYFNTLDRLIVDGVALGKGDGRDTPIWREFSLFRWFDWGVVESTWDTSRINRHIEDAGLIVARQIRGLLQDEQLASNEVATLRMLFDPSPYLPTERDWLSHVNQW